MAASSTSSAASLVASLRKKTGYPIGKCKEALTKHGNDLDAAETWLLEQAKKEGWAKAEKLMGRKAQQGLIGLVVKNRQAAMVVVNCETDFVARNDKFRSLVEKVTHTVLDKCNPQPLSSTDIPSILTLDTQSLGSLDLNSGTGNLSDLVAESIGLLSENIVLGRACLMGVKKGTLCGYTYSPSTIPPSTVAMGTYAALVHLLPAGREWEDEEAARNLGMQIGQHIVGMNPSSVYGSSDNAEPLVGQKYLLDSTLTVGDLLKQKNTKVSSFVRYALSD
ncbi:hypothetical protein EMCRGX_G014207 [Ephydatia muelleri]